MKILVSIKTGISKKDQQKYKYEYVHQDMQFNFKKTDKTGPKRQTLDDKEKKKHKKEAVEKWQNKEFVCENCNKTYKNSYKYNHNQFETVESFHDVTAILENKETAAMLEE